MRVDELQRSSARRPDAGITTEVIAPGESFASVTEQISGVVLSRRPPRFWWVSFAIGLLLLADLLVAATALLYKGVGLFGINIPVAWGFAITNFVWWIGIGHAGTLISAFLLLLNQSWRNA